MKYQVSPAYIKKYQSALLMTAALLVYFIFSMRHQITYPTHFVSFLTSYNAKNFMLMAMGMITLPFSFIGYYRLTKRYFSFDEQGVRCAGYHYHLIQWQDLKAVRLGGPRSSWLLFEMKNNRSVFDKVGWFAATCMQFSRWRTGALVMVNLSQYDVNPQKILSQCQSYLDAS